MAGRNGLTGCNDKDKCPSGRAGQGSLKDSIGAWGVPSQLPQEVGMNLVRSTPLSVHGGCCRQGSEPARRLSAPLRPTPNRDPLRRYPACPGSSLCGVPTPVTIEVNGKDREMGTPTRVTDDRARRFARPHGRETVHGTTSLLGSDCGCGRTEAGHRSCTCDRPAPSSGARWDHSKR